MIKLKWIEIFWNRWQAVRSGFYSLIMQSIVINIGGHHCYIFKIIITSIVLWVWLAMTIIEFYRNPWGFFYDVSFFAFFHIYIEKCLNHTWYLSVDMQLFLFAPLLSYLLYHFGYIFVPILGLLIAGCIGWTYWLYVHFDLVNQLLSIK